MGIAGWVLKTICTKPPGSPFGGLRRAESPSEETLEKLTNLGRSVAIVALENRGLLELQSVPGSPPLSQVLALESAEIGTMQWSHDALIALLRPDLALAICHSQRSFEPLLGALPANPHVSEADPKTTWTVTDVTHGRAGILVIGTRAHTVLARLCSLDLNPKAFPSARATQTSLAKVKALIARWDLGRLPTYYICFDRSLARYLWQVLETEIQDFDPLILDPGMLGETWPAEPEIIA
jgi:sarcosine oxidase subunit gamma